MADQGQVVPRSPLVGPQDIQGGDHPLEGSLLEMDLHRALGFAQAQKRG